MSRSLAEDFLELEEIETNLYRADTKHLWVPPKGRGVFGGQVVGQAVMAAIRTVPTNLHVHSLHTYFILACDSKVPVIYHVQRIRDGRTFATRTVKATQKGRCIFTCSCSFKLPEISKHQYTIPMPDVPPPESLLNLEEIYKKWASQPGIPERSIRYLQMLANHPAPVEMRPAVEPKFRDSISPEPLPPEKRVWMRVRGRLVDDEHLHQAILAYATDYQLLGTSVRPLGVSSASRPERVKMIISLDHSVWFHAPIRTDEWFLYDMVVDYVGSNRAFTRGRIYTRDGILAASVAQEGILRIGPADDNTTPTTNSKL